MQEHTILVAITVTAESREIAEKYLHLKLPTVGQRHLDTVIESWWIAEDERYDRSDCDSAVFVKPGNQVEAVALLRKAGLAF